jgi:uncharacterized protein (DUF1015 family)
MADVRPFCALRPRNDLAREVIAPPYDVMTDAEARAEARAPRSFVHVTRSEVDLVAGTDPHSGEAYRKARENLDAFVADATLTLDSQPSYYLYGQVMGNHCQAGLLAACSIAEYDAGLIRKHEFTRPDKEDDRTVHMEALDAQVGLVFLAYRNTRGLQTLLATVLEQEPAWRVRTEDEVEHALWVVPPELTEPIRLAFEQVPTLYIADGHHRSAAAARVHAHRKDPASAYFLAGLFPDDALQVMAYNRVVHDLNGLSLDEFLGRVREHFSVEPSPSAAPDRRGVITLLVGGQWLALRPLPGLVDPKDPVASLDVSILQDHLLQPILGIDDPRRSKRIDFVGGIRGAAALERAVADGAAVAFHLFPTGLDQLFAVADKGEVMPPKSTWFEPKLREGVAVRLLREGTVD